MSSIESLSRMGRIKQNKNFRYLVLAGLIIVISLFFSIINPHFFSLVNIGILLRSIAVLFLLSMGMTYVMITGGIDLSVGSNVAFSGAIGAVVVVGTGNAFLGVVCSLASGAALGFINGFFVGKLKLSAFMITLATMALGRGLTLVILKADSISVENELFLWLGKTSIGPFPIVILFVAIVFVFLHKCLTRSSWGRDIFAVGSNESTAFLLGRKVNQIIISAYVLNGVLAGISGVITVGRVSSGQPWAGLNLEFDAITSVILGGTSLAGGEGNLIGTIIGVVFYGIIINGLILTGANPYLQSVAKGVVLLIIVCLDYMGKREK